MKKKSVLLLITFNLIFFFGCASQHEVMLVSERLGIVERYQTALDQEKKAAERDNIQFKDQQKKIIDEKEQSLRSQSADLRLQIDQIKEQIGALNGKFEEAGYSLKQNIDSSQNIIKEKEEKLNKIEERVAMIEKFLGINSNEKVKESSSSNQTKEETPKETASAETTDNEAPTKEISGKDLYATAKQAYDDGDMEKSLAGFKEYLGKFPKSKNADSAQFWIGEVYFAQKWFEKAIIEYQKVIEKYPKGNKVASALLKQGLGFYNLGDKKNARLVLNEVVNKYPKSNEAKIAKQKLKNPS